MQHLPQWHWRYLALPARYFAWRVRGSALALLDPANAHCIAPPPDVLVATSMFDLATARAIVPAVRALPALVYFHENQFVYPGHENGRADTQMITLRSALAADRVVFNSRYNRDTFFGGAADLLARMPDGVPPALLDAVSGRSTVLPVPLPADLPPAPPRSGSGPLRVLWNHRWEEDKAPQRLLAALRLLRQRGVHCELVLRGQQFRRRPVAFDRLLAEFTRPAPAGFAERGAYLATLGSADVVVSTALHDFQGLAVLEAIACGCVPAVPDRLAYREFVAPRYRYASHPGDAAAEAESLAAMLAELAAVRAHGPLPAPDPPRLSWSALADDYHALVAGLAGCTGDGVGG